MSARNFVALVALLVASSVFGHSWNDDSHYVSLGSRTGNYIVRPGSVLSRHFDSRALLQSTRQTRFVMDMEQMHWPSALTELAFCRLRPRILSRRDLTNFIHDVSVLLFAAALPRATWNYFLGGRGARNCGPMA